MRKTFIFYNDWIDYTIDMTLEEKGLFLQTILRYQNHEDLGDISQIKFIWSRVKRQIDDDHEKWSAEVEKRKDAGKLGGIRSGEARRKADRKEENEANEASASKTKQVLPTRSKPKQTQANEADNENVNDNDNDIIKDIIKDTTIVVSKSEKDFVENSFEQAEFFFEIIKDKIKTNSEIETEMMKFFDYWTAPMKSGKPLWKSQKTFAFRARLRNWMDKSKTKIPNSFFSNNKPARGTIG